MSEEYMSASPSGILRWSFLFLRSIIWTVLIPGTVTVYLFYRILSRSSQTVIESWGPTQFLSLIPIVIGTAILFNCIWNFAVVGKGTLSPVDAPRHLVVRGLYRYVRNPMYAGVLIILLGEALYFKSVVLVGFAFVFFVVINLVIMLIEEPGLRRQFGEPYERYCRYVHRWLPAKRFDPDGLETTGH